MGEAPTELEIVRLPPEEWRAYRELRLRALHDEPQAFGEPHDHAVALPERHWRRRLEDAQDQGAGDLLFARRGGELVGLIGSFPYEPAANSNAKGTATREVRIYSVFVAAEERGRGTGARLMEAMLAALADSRRYDRVSLTVSEAQSAAVGLYRRFGFEVIDRVTAVLGDGQEHPELVMARPLP